MKSKDKESIILAGKIVSEIRKEIEKIVKKDKKLLEIAEEIENLILSKGGKPAFPVNLSIDEIAAHYTPAYNDESLARGLIKVDFGVQINGWSADNSITLDLENDKENKNLIEAAEKSLQEGLKKIKYGENISLIGEIVEEKINSFNTNPIINLCGHSIDEYDLHSGLTIPNVKTNSKEIFDEGVYAIEPFTTNGGGKVKDGKPSGIYQLNQIKNPRSDLAREILDFIITEYNGLPFCSRWIIKKFGKMSLIALNQLEREDIIYQYSQLVESTKAKVAQAEHTILVEKDKTIIITGNP